MPEITLIFTTILSAFMIILSVRVLDLRRSPVTKFLHKPNRIIDDETLQRSIRGHGNLVEYAPLFLILMLVLELSEAPQTQLYFSGIVFTVGRLMHGIVFSFMRRNIFLRIGGMAFTFVGFLGLIRTSIILLF
ncbi:MAPEG family protein [Gammaproteobacteria bacterium]|jgi:uncharacterized membrane protein YecN with MAPEG domain|nr:MAPEG family protein [Gammaproteobacteria bacterium]MDA9355827.1 MAPEG family protein [Gammaproteobacteria bacterium]MDB4243829.1 MAPEG family protein [Gammaproteobacteria bacterium]MDB9747272.1 MAPEG family protein [Gammaproteobacteria bacterium]MDC1189795.1 MAPEG family protein [Gammaproteobacteria bacterium]|tara:strand:+ start:89 stop:487 length:399 start_codon:yes stop_codon:yes gene_type:complete